MLTQTKLYVIGIPIGNIFDFSQRSTFILKNVDIIVTEDSRKLGKNLKFLKINNKIISITNYNEITLSIKLVKYIKLGKKIALITDSGTPLISDPGYFFINYAYKNNIKIIPIPGPSSITTSLSISSLNIKDFFFIGFLPKNYIEKKILLKKILKKNNSYIFFESSQRIIETLFIIYNFYKLNKKINIFKDLTKRFEYNIFLDLDYFFLYVNTNKIMNIKKGELTITLQNKIKNNIYKKKTANKLNIFNHIFSSKSKYHIF